MIFSLINSGASFREIIIQLLLTLPVILMSLTLHECAHGWMASKCGDNTAKNLGRLTINPIKHLDPVGAICMLLFGIGWAKPVPINSRNFRHPRRDIALTAAAGPVTNLICAFALALIQAIFVTVVGTETVSATIWMYVLWLFLYIGVELNAFLAVFNLLPIPPFDGSKILYIFLPAKWYFKIAKYEKYIHIAILILLFTNILDVPLQWLTGGIVTIIYKLVYLIPFLG